MEGQEYLNQIAAGNRPTVKKSGGIFSSKIFLFGMISLAALIVIIIIGAILGGNKGGEKNLCFALKLHLDGTTEVIGEYQTHVKSSSLRSSSASFNNVVSDTNNKLTEYITAKYDYKEKSVDKKILGEAQTKLDELKTDLFEAKINGILDRVYAHKMAYEVSLLMTEETKIINSSGNDTLKEILSASNDSLKKLYDDFNNFSEAK